MNKRTACSESEVRAAAAWATLLNRTSRTRGPGADKGVPTRVSSNLREYNTRITFKFAAETLRRLYTQIKLPLSTEISRMHTHIHCWPIVRTSTSDRGHK
jgi:hypothetical protein